MNTIFFASYTAYSSFPSLDVAPSMPSGAVHHSDSELSRLEQFHQLRFVFACDFFFFCSAFCF